MNGRRQVDADDLTFHRKSNTPGGQHMNTTDTADSIDSVVDVMLDTGGRLFLATASDGISSGASVFFARDADSLVFFTFNPTRKAEQIRANPRVGAVVWPAGSEGVRGLQIEGRCHRITDERERARARQLILEVTDAFAAYMDDPFLVRNGVTGYYRLTPLRIMVVDFHHADQFRIRHFPNNAPADFIEAVATIVRRVRLWLRALRAPFFTATLVPVALGGAVATLDLSRAGAAGLDVKLFALTLVGAVAAHAGANLANDYGDHRSGADRGNPVPSPFNGGSRVIQAGLLAPWKIMAVAMVCFGLCIVAGLFVNREIGGSWFAQTPVLWLGIAGVALAATYTLGPFRLAYEGLGEAAIALGFGPLLVLGTHFVATASTQSRWAWPGALAVSIPVAIQVLLIVWINQFQDAPADAASGKHNWVVRLARQADGFDYHRPFRWYVGLNVAAFASVAMLAAAPLVGGAGTRFAVIALAPALLAGWAIRRGRRWLDAIDDGVDWRRHPYALLSVNAATIGVHFATGVLLTLAFVLERYFGGV